MAAEGLGILIRPWVRKYVAGVALNGVPIRYPQINTANNNWHFFDPINNIWIDSGVVARGVSPRISPTTNNWEVWNDSTGAFVDTGIRPDGFSPTITVHTNTATQYILTITTATGSFNTPNIKGQGSGGTGGAVDSVDIAAEELLVAVDLTDPANPKIASTQALQDAVAKANSALQSFTETDPIYAADKPNLEIISNRVALSAAGTETQYPTAKSTWDVIQAAIATIPEGGLKLPVEIDKESDLPLTGTDGDFYIIQDMDITAPGRTGKAWWNSVVSTTEWLKVFDQYYSADSVSIVLTPTGALSVSGSWLDGIILTAISAHNTDAGAHAAQFAGKLGINDNAQTASIAEQLRNDITSPNIINNVLQDVIVAHMPSVNSSRVVSCSLSANVIDSPLVQTIGTPPAFCIIWRGNNDGNIMMIVHGMPYFRRIQSMATTPAWAGGWTSQIVGVSNPNILHNWDFRNPVNQRALTEYIGAVYGLDRWQGTLTSSRIKKEDKYVTFGGTNAVSTVVQTIEFSEKYIGLSVTLSVLLLDGTVRSMSTTIPPFTGVAWGSTSIQLQGGVCYLYRTPAGLLRFEIQALANQQIDIQAAKLELGLFSTLSNDSPMDYGVELAKCQRYQFPIGTSSSPFNYFTTSGLITANAIHFYVTTPHTMRIVPRLVPLESGLTPIIAVRNNNQADGTQQIAGFDIIVHSIASNCVRIDAIKTAHGLTSPALNLQNILLDANL